MNFKPGALDAILDDENRDKFGLHYLGTAMMLAWYYCLWFTPNIFIYEDLLAEIVTFSWLATLAASGIAFLAVAVGFNGKFRLYEHPEIILIAALVASAATAAYTLWPDALVYPAFSLFAFPVAFGASNAIVWVGLGEFHARNKSTFSTNKFIGIFGVVILLSMILTSALPHLAAVAFVTVLPLLSAFIYMKENGRLGDAPLPTLLPTKTRKKTLRTTTVVSITIFVACAACYFNIAIIPIDTLGIEEVFDPAYSYVIGICAAGLLAISVALGNTTFAKEHAIAYRVLPWLFVATAGAIALFANGDEPLYLPSFLITVMMAGVFEVVLIAYFGTLSSKGFIPTALAFGISSAVVRLGFFAGDAIAVVYEHNAFLADNFTTETSLLFLCGIVICLVHLVRQENIILQLTTAAVSRSAETDEVCDAAIVEFALSKREGEILKYIARGYTIDNISKKLVISPYTTQTHVRHIYSKMHVHKRSELLDYINMHRSE